MAGGGAGAPLALNPAQTWRRRGKLPYHVGRSTILEPVYDQLRVGDTALKTPSKCSCTVCTFRFLSGFRLVSP
ncbi:hypothetical protein DXT74_18160 [Chromobacterium sp. Rain0013]|nr:hypothetical protein DXT74_18160 [Chromobacterium sp. Rain0013]